MTTTEAKQMPDQASAAAAAAAPVHQTGDSDPSKDPSQTQKKEKKEGEKGPSDRRDITPKPKLTKAERREKQEKQREAKRTQQQQKQHDSGGGGTGRTSDQNPQSSSQHDKKVESTAPANGNTKQDPSNQSPVGSTEGVVQTKSTMDSMFAHLPPYKGMCCSQHSSPTIAFNFYFSVAHSRLFIFFTSIRTPRPACSRIHFNLAPRRD